MILINVCVYSQDQLLDKEAWNSSSQYGESSNSGRSADIIVPNYQANNYNGNLTINHSETTALPNDLSVNFEINYNANVDHIFRPLYVPLPGVQEGSSLNYPEWIVGINGFAIQTLNFEKNFFAHKSSTDLGQSLLYGDQIPILINGYHYTNSLRYWRNTNITHDYNPKYDFIYLLKSDGSTITLYNPKPVGNFGSDNSDSRVGTYIEYGKTNYGYAKVSWKFGSSELRDIYYKPGDGLTYHFVEEFGDYYCPSYSSQPLSTDTWNLIFDMIRPKIAYLREIISPVGDKLSFDYDFDGFSSTNTTWGRKFFKSLHYLRSDATIADLYSFEYNKSGSFPNTQYGISIDNFIKSTSLSFSLKSDKFQLSSISIDDLERYSQISYPNYVNIFEITSITDNINRSTNYYYLDSYNYKYARRFRGDYINFEGNFQNEYKLILSVPRLWYYVTQNKWMEFTYWDTKLNGVEIPYNLNDGEFTDNSFWVCYGINKYHWWDIKHYNPSNINYSMRDNYTNLILQSIKTRHMNNGVPTDIKKESFTYTWDGTRTRTDNPPNFPAWANDLFLPWDPFISNIKTTKTIENLSTEQSSAPSSVTDIFLYQMHIQDYFELYYLPEIKKNISLMSSERFYSDGTTNLQKQLKYTYNVGNLVGGQYASVYTGNFLTTRIDEKIILLGSSGNELGSKTISKYYDYTYANYHLGDVTNNVTKSVIASKDETQGDYHKVKYFKHFIPALGNFSDESQLHKTFLDELQVEGTYPVETFRKQSEYYGETEEFPGKLKTEKIIGNNNYQQLREKTATFTYSSTEKYKGLLSSKRYDNGIVEYFYYPGEGGYTTANAKKVYSNGTVVNETIEHLNFQIYPFKTITQFPSRYVLEKYSAYDEAGKLLKEINEDGYLSEYEYDPIGRLLVEFHPGSFDPTNTSVLDTLIGDQVLSQALSIDDKGENFVSNRLVIKRAEKVSQESSEEGISANSSEDSDKEIAGLPYLNAYSFLYEPLITANILSTVDAVLHLNIITSEISESESKVVYLKGVSQNYSSEYLSYETVGDSIEIIVEQTGPIDIDISRLLHQFKLSGKNLYGFKFFTEDLLNESSTKLIEFMSSLVQPSLETNLIVNTGVLGSKNYTYSDNNWIPDVSVTKTLKFDPLNSKVLNNEVKFLPSEMKTNNNTLNNGINYSTTEKKINYLGLDASSMSAENIKEFYKYNGFGELVKKVFISDIVASPSVAYNYNYNFDNLNINGVPYFRTTTTVDESGNTVIEYFDEFDLKIAEKHGTDNPINFTYNSGHQLTTVTSSQGRVTQYIYDDYGNISEVNHPDAGIIRNKYDRYSNLRFQYYPQAPSAENKILFYKYDLLNRPIITGSLNSAYDYALLDPDLDYSSNHPQVPHFENYLGDYNDKFLIYNVYDDYMLNGVFENISDPGDFLPKNRKGKLVATAFRDKLNDNWNYKVYSYDELGRVKYFWIKYGSNGWKDIQNDYDHTGNLVKQSLNLSSSLERIFYWYYYDNMGRLIEVRSSKENTESTAIIAATYNYNKDNQNTTITYPTLPSTQRTTAIAYQDRGWVSSITGQYTSHLSYNNNGNIYNNYIIGILGWPNINFSYTYDNKNQLRFVNNNGAWYEQFIYDQDGNISSNQKQGKYIAYYYPTANNKLERIRINNGADLYFTYDYKGNITTAPHKNLTNITYDYRNNISSLTSSGTTYSYKYDDNGNRIFKSNQNEFYLVDNFGKELAIYDYSVPQKLDKKID